MTRLLRTWSVDRLRRRALWHGAASAFDLRGNTMRLYRLGSDPSRVDNEAIRADFEAVGADLRAAMDGYAQSH